MTVVLGRVNHKPGTSAARTYCLLECLVDLVAISLSYGLQEHPLGEIRIVGSGICGTSSFGRRRRADRARCPDSARSSRRLVDEILVYFLYSTVVDRVLDKLPVK